MKQKKIKLSVLLVAIGITAQAQQATISSGGDALGSGGTVSYSVGQVVYTTNSGSNGSVSQGVQQVYGIFALGIKETALNSSISVFPNPTSDNLTLEISDFKNEKLAYQLYDMQGKLVSGEEVSTVQTQINTVSLTPSTYFIHVVNQGNEKVQSFKIVKN